MRCGRLFLPNARPPAPAPGSCQSRQRSPCEWSAGGLTGQILRVLVEMTEAPQPGGRRRVGTLQGRCRLPLDVDLVDVRPCLSLMPAYCMTSKIDGVPTQPDKCR